jgi:hypothetical protein
MADLRMTEGIQRTDPCPEMSSIKEQVAELIRLERKTVASQAAALVRQTRRQIQQDAPKFGPRAVSVLLEQLERQIRVL